MALRSVSLRYFNVAGADRNNEQDPENPLIPLILEAALASVPAS